MSHNTLAAFQQQLPHVVREHTVLRQFETQLHRLVQHWRIAIEPPRQGAHVASLLADSQAPPQEGHRALRRHVASGRAGLGDETEHLL